MAIVDTQGLMEQAVIREPKDYRGIRDSQGLEALAGILEYLGQAATLESKVFQATLDTRVSRAFLDYPVFQDILDKLVYLDIPGSKVSVAIQESWVYPDTVGITVSLDTQEVMD